jgi:hypothetical protein
VHLSDIPDLNTIDYKPALGTTGEIRMEGQDAHLEPLLNQTARNVEITPPGRPFNAHWQEKNDPPFGRQFPLLLTGMCEYIHVFCKKHLSSVQFVCQIGND